MRGQQRHLLHILSFSTILNCLLIVLYHCLTPSLTLSFRNHIYFEIKVEWDRCHLKK